MFYKWNYLKKVHMLMFLLSLLCFIYSIRVEINGNYLQKILFLYFLHFLDSPKILKKQKLYLQLQRRLRHGNQYQEISKYLIIGITKSSVTLNLQNHF